MSQRRRKTCTKLHVKIFRKEGQREKPSLPPPAAHVTAGEWKSLSLLIDLKTMQKAFCHWYGNISHCHLLLHYFFMCHVSWTPLSLLMPSGVVVMVSVSVTQHRSTQQRENTDLWITLSHSSTTIAIIAATHEGKFVSQRTNGFSNVIIFCFNVPYTSSILVRTCLNAPYTLFIIVRHWFQFLEGV